MINKERLKSHFEVQSKYLSLPAHFFNTYNLVTEQADGPLVLSGTALPLSLVMQ